MKLFDVSVQISGLYLQPYLLISNQMKISNPMQQYLWNTRNIS